MDTILQTDKITVVGGINVDLEARSFEPLIDADSNPGQIRTSLGGVGFNIARNLSLLGSRVTMLTALAEDGSKERILAEAAEYGIDLSRAVTVPGAAAASYVYICGPDGEMSLAVCDAEILHRVNEDYLQSVMKFINGVNASAGEETDGSMNASAGANDIGAADAVVVDANLDETALNYLAAHCRKPLFSDPVSVTKAARMKQMLPRLFALKPNRLEAEALTGIRVSDRESAALAAAKLHEAGVQHVFLSLGSRGLCYCGPDGVCIFREGFRVRTANANGSGDTMMAAIVRSFGMKLTAAERVDFVLAAAALAVEDAGTIRKDLTTERILALAGCQNRQMM